MKFHGNIDLLDNEMRQMVLQAETSYPNEPKAGRIIFKDKRVYICVEVLAGIPSWVPLTNEIDTYLFSQNTAATEWTITHNLNTATPLVQIYEKDSNLYLIPDEIEVISAFQVKVRFANAAAGRAVVMFGDIMGGDKSSYSYTHEQTSASTTWTIPHNLGYNPIVRVFIGNEEVQPLSVVHDSLFQVTLTFSSAQSGVARLI